MQFFVKTNKLNRIKYFINNFFFSYFLFKITDKKALIKKAFNFNYCQIGYWQRYAVGIVFIIISYIFY